MDSKHSLNLHDMTESEIVNALYEGRGVGEFVSINDVFTFEQICTLPSHPAWYMFSSHFKAWVSNTIEYIILQDEAIL